MELGISKRLIFFLTAIIFMVGCLYTTPVEAKAYLNGWDLVDSGKHLDVDGDSVYMNRIWDGKNIWNGYKKGVVRKDSVSVVEDVFVKDMDIKNGKAGSTSNTGIIKLNKYYLKDFSITKRTNTATHELGHALGLGHSTSADIMYAEDSTRIVLSKNDKDSYDSAYKNY